MRRKSWMRGVLALGCALGTGVSAQGVVEDLKVTGGTKDTMMPVNVRLLAGLSDFTGDLGERTQVGPLAGVMVETPRWQFWGIEGGYEGSRNAVSDDFGGDGAIWRHNLTAMLKAGPEIQEKILPFAAAGLGGSIVNASDDATNFTDDSDLVVEVPVALGVDYRVTDTILAGVRGTYRVLADEDFAAPTGVENPSGGALQANLSLAGRF